MQMYVNEGILYIGNNSIMYSFWRNGKINCHITEMVEINKKVGIKDEEKVDLSLSGEVKNCIFRLKHRSNIFLLLKTSCLPTQVKLWSILPASTGLQLAAILIFSQKNH